MLRDGGAVLAVRGGDRGFFHGETKVDIRVFNSSNRLTLLVLKAYSIKALYELDC